MQVEAVYNQGRLEFVQPIKLKHDRLRLVVMVPDDEIDTPPTPYNLPPEELARAQALLEKYQAILDAPFAVDADLPDLSTKYQERLEAIDLRAQIRQEQGRPI